MTGHVIDTVEAVQLGHELYDGVFSDNNTPMVYVRAVRTLENFSQGPRGVAFYVPMALLPNVTVGKQYRLQLVPVEAES